MRDIPKQTSGTPKQPGIYKILTGIKGLPPWTQYFNGVSWHGSPPPQGATILGPLLSGDEELEEEHRPEPVPTPKPNPKIEVDQFRCGICNNTQFDRRSITQGGVTTFEIFCEFCAEAEKRLPQLPVSNSGRVILDAQGHAVARCDWLSKSDERNAEVANLIVAAVNAWNDITQLVNCDDPGLSCYLYKRIAKQVHSYETAASRKRK